MSSRLNFIESNISLKEKSYYKMGGKAKYMAFPCNFTQIAQSISFAKSHSLPIAILGAGSNSVFSDEDFDGLVISLEKLAAWWWETDDILFAEGGVTNTEIAEICLAEERSGASWMYRMPGQIGASVRMNARCYGGEMTQIVKEIITIDQNGHLNSHDAQKILVGYKETALMHKPEIVVGVRFYLPNTGSAQDILAHMHACEKDRHTKQHFLFPSCGSTFKNNYAYGKPSGRIFDELGLKGTQRGDAEISLYHGNFVWNKNFASTKDMLNLAAFMRSEAQEKLNVELNLEVQPIGMFDPDTFESCGMKNLGPFIYRDGKYLTGLFMSSRGGALSSRPDFHRDKLLTAGPSTFPSRIFSCFFMNYYHNKIQNLPFVDAEIWQLQSFHDAQKNPTTPFLRWTTQCKTNFQDIFKLAPNSDSDCKTLWNFSVSEIFFAHPNKPHYFECEMTPYGDTLKIHFDNIRQQNHTPSLYSHSLTPGSHEFSMEFSFDDLKQYIDMDDAVLNVQCALSLGHEQYFLAPYWTSQPIKADFHQPAKFWQLNLLL